MGVGIRSERLEKRQQSRQWEISGRKHRGVDSSNTVKGVNRREIGGRTCVLCVTYEREIGERTSSVLSREVGRRTRSTLRGGQSYRYSS